MLKKYTAILMLFTAYAILLGHNTIPHHHHDSDRNLTGQHNADHHQDQDESDNDELTHLFSHFTHSADGHTFKCTHSTDNTSNKELLTPVIALSDGSTIDAFLLPALLHKPPSEQFNYVPPNALPSGLRAPPYYFI